MTTILDKEIKLKRVLSVWDSTAFLICIIIGSGIFISPKGVLQETGSPGMALIIWLAAGLMNLVISFCYAELALTFPTAGSDYTYIREAFGEVPSFLLVWVSILLQDNASKAILSLTFSAYFCQMFFSGCAPPELAKRLVAVLALTIVTFLQCVSSKWAVKLGDFFTVAKLVGLALIIISGLWYLFSGHMENLEGLFDNSSSNVGSYALAFYASYWAYGGVATCCNVIEEMKEPIVRNVLVSITISQIAIMVVYLLTNLSYIVALTGDEILASEAVAMTFGDRILPGLSWIMPFFVACSTFGSMSNGIMSASRMTLAATRQRHFPSFLILLSVHFVTPIPILVSTVIVGVAMIFMGQVYDLILYTSYIGVLGMAGSVVALIYLRITKPELERPLRLPLVLPVINLLMMLLLLFFPFYQKPVETSLCFAAIATGLPVYFLLIQKKDKPRWLLTLDKEVTHFVQKLILALPEEQVDTETAASGETNPGFEFDVKKVS